MTKRRWFVLVFAALALLLANAALSGALELGWARRTLLARLSASFGRPVEVRRFQFNLLSGLRLEANEVTVSEDPRFGQEYFLRADQQTLDFRVVNRRNVASRTQRDLPAGTRKKIERRVLQAAFGDAQLQLHDLLP